VIVDQEELIEHAQANADDGSERPTARRRRGRGDGPQLLSRAPALRRFRASTLSLPGSTLFHPTPPADRPALNTQPRRTFQPPAAVCRARSLPLLQSGRTLRI
jgi:hypothetical protein